MILWQDHQSRKRKEQFLSEFGIVECDYSALYSHFCQPVPLTIAQKFLDLLRSDET
jgi:hypothetical protein